MNRLVKSLINRALAKFDYRMVRIPAVQCISPVEFSPADVEIMRYVLDRKLTMVSPQRLIATIQACKYAIQAEIAGDFVECGVWRGGNSLAAKLVFEQYGSDRRVILFDTFAGMTEPTELDTSLLDGAAARARFEKSRRAEHNAWCYASLEDVERNFRDAGSSLANVRFVRGDVLETLEVEENLPAAISVLRLDTDWYESTRMEMDVLYPRLSHGGVLLIDDYGHWAGARRAVDEYFAHSGAPRPLLQYTDYAGRMGVKP